MPLLENSTKKCTDAADDYFLSSMEKRVCEKKVRDNSKQICALFLGWHKLPVEVAMCCTSRVHAAGARIRSSKLQQQQQQQLNHDGKNEKMMAALAAPALRACDL